MSSPPTTWSDNPLYWEGIARSAAEAADAMLRERDKRDWPAPQPHNGG